MIYIIIRPVHDIYHILGIVYAAPIYVIFNIKQTKNTSTGYQNLRGCANKTLIYEKIIDFRRGYGRHHHGE
jgi:hypothetical protein